MPSFAAVQALATPYRSYQVGLGCQGRSPLQHLNRLTIISTSLDIVDSFILVALAVAFLPFSFSLPLYSFSSQLRRWVL